MEIIIGALITGCVTLLASYFMYLSKINKVLDNGNSLNKALSDSKTSLSDEHDRLSDEHGRLFHEHEKLLTKQETAAGEMQQILRITDDTKGIAQKIWESSIQEKSNRKYQYENLSEKQRDISVLINSNVDGIKMLHAEFLRLNTAYTVLHEEYENLQDDRDQLEIRQQLLQEESNRLQEQVKHLKQENRQLKETIQRPKKRNPENFYER